MNIKGVFQIWMQDGSYHEINLKECHAWTREGCNPCPDFAAEHADISTGGIGKYNDWTLTIVRTDLGREVMSRMIEDGTIVARPGDDDPGAIALMHKLSKKSRERWPGFAVDFPQPREEARTARNVAPSRRSQCEDRCSRHPVVLASRAEPLQCSQPLAALDWPIAMAGTRWRGAE